MSSIDKQAILPQDVSAWDKMVSSYDDDVSDIHNLEVIKSASKIHKGQFLSLRVLWGTFKAGTADFQKLGLASKHESACQFLDSLTSWANYVEDIRNLASNSEDAFPDLGTFTLVRDHQLEAARISEEADTSNVGFSPVANRTRSNARTQQGIQDSPLFGKGKEKNTENIEISLEELDIGSPESSPSTVFGVSPINSEAAAMLYPATRDEQIVNTALLLFLRAVSIHKLRNPRWTLHRRTFTVQFPKGKLEARTDGYLDLNVGGNSIVKAIVEVKPFVRAENKQVRMQESAQVVAWIANEPDTIINPDEVKQRLLISQDRQEMFLIRAIYDNDYLLYLQGKQAPRSFLSMEEHGPYNVTNYKHMEKLGRIILAFTMVAQSEA